MEAKHSANFIDKTGMKFGKLTAREYLGNKMWRCDCDCGNTNIIISSDRLVINPTKTHRGTRSCGCGHNSRLTPNVTYFEKIDCEEKAYILGLLASDGTITNSEEFGNYTIKLVLQQRDMDILEKIKEAIRTKADIKQYTATSKLPQGGTCISDLCSLAIHSKPLVQQLEKYGIVPNKSLILCVDYTLIPEEFKKDFWRRLVDGDGTFGVFGKKNIIGFNITTSVLMAEETQKEILKIFPNFHINIYQAIGCNENTTRFIITTQQDIADFLNYIYKNSKIYINRKYQRYLEVEEFWKNNNN